MVNEIISGMGKNPVKEEGTERRNGRNLVNTHMTDTGIVSIERIGTIGTVTGIGTGKGKETGVGIVIEHVIVIETEVGIVVVTMIVIDIENEIESVIVAEIGRVRET